MQNYLRVTIRKIKVINDNSITNFNLKIELFKHIQEIEKLSSQEIEINRSFFWEVPSNSKQDSIEISAISKTLYIFDSILAKINIQINPIKLNDSSEWYYLKNNKNENIIGVLLSLYFDSKDKQNQILNNETSFIATKNLNSKADISCDYIKYSNINTNNLFLNIINRTKNISIINESIDCIKIGNNHQSQFIDNKKKSESNNRNKAELKLDTTMIHDETVKSPDSSLANNILSPFSCRIENEKLNLSKFNPKNVYSSGNLNKYKSSSNDNDMIDFVNNNRSTSNFNSNLQNTMEENKQNEENFFETIYKRLEKIYGLVKENCNNSMINQYNINNSMNYYNNINSQNVKDELYDIINKLMVKTNLLKDEFQKLGKMKDEIKKNKEKMKNKELIILKEKTKLENEIKNFKLNKAEIENKNNFISQQIFKYTNDLNKLNLDKEMFEFEKNTFFKINFMLNTGKNIDNMDCQKVKDMREIRKKLSINNLSLPTTNFTGNSSGSFTSKIIAKGSSQKTSIDVKKDNLIENSVHKMKRDNSADIVISNIKQKHISNIDENSLQISSNNLLNYGSNSVTKNQLSQQNLVHNNSITNNILNNLSSLENLINSPKDKKEKPFTSNTINPNKQDLNFSSSSQFNSNYFTVGPNTTMNKHSYGIMNENEICNTIGYNLNSVNSNNLNVNTSTNQNIDSCSNSKNNLNNSLQTCNKFYTPIAQIDLNKNKNNLKNAISYKGDNKLIDSLDNLAYISSQNKQNIILFNDKKYSNLKFKRAGSDDKPKNNESKRTSNFKGNTTATNLNHPGFPTTTKEKEKKLILKQSLDKQYKTNKESTNVTNNLATSLSNSINNKYNSRLMKKIK